MNVQSGKNPMLETLDCPDPAAKAPRRNITTTPLQALEMMNSSFVLRQSAAFANRLNNEAGTSPERQVNLAYQRALGRSPRPMELKSATSLIRSSGLQTLCWALFNTSEFVYVR